MLKVFEGSGLAKTVGREAGVVHVTLDPSRRDTEAKLCQGSNATRVC